MASETQTAELQRFVTGVEIEGLEVHQAPRGRPPYMAHRGAVSTAYYAVFHAITGRVVKAPFTESGDSGEGSA